MKGIDCATPLNAKTAADIKAAGYDFAGRYLVPERGTLKWKALTAQEIAECTAAGLLILSVYETTAARPSCGFTNGLEDGKSAYERAKSLGVPEGACIYFAADYDAQQMGAVEAYLAGARQELHGEYRIGIYGSYYVVEEMAKREAADCFWQCVAWSKRQVSRHYHVYQHTAGQSVAGVGVDINDCPDAYKAGLWDANGIAENEEDKDMDVNRFKELWHEMRQELQDNDAAGWSQEAREWAVSTGLVKGGSGDEFNWMWEDVLTREQMVVLLYRFMKMMK